IEAWADQPAEGEENPALLRADTEQVWPLPLDETALARRRAAAETVLAHLDRLASADGPHHARPATVHDADTDTDADADTYTYDDPDWPPPPEDDEPPQDEHP
ncbi:hypothetical protein NGM37_47095, partial [Streptomyces sp. TRM76130]|nr:hypothetical protein [Streptomyces sp. TRM76130]